MHCKSTLTDDFHKRDPHGRLLEMNLIKLPEDKMKKKIQNMNSKTRRIYLKNVTGKKPIKANAWQKEIKKQLYENDTNPVFH